MDKHLELLRSGILPSELEIRVICNKVKEILSKEDNVVKLSLPITICGDIHGQFYDLLELFAIGDDCPETNYCFMGDYVDRGHHGVETILFLLITKIKYPHHLTLLRGNHESRNITQVYGFYEECLEKFNVVNVYNYLTDVFDFLPLTALVNQEYFVVHGGLSPHIENIDEINTFERIDEIPNHGPISDLLWSDPTDLIDEWDISERGAGYIFGTNAVKKFSESNNLKCIFRSHQFIDCGYKYMFNDMICTVWSAPNYSNRNLNIAAILEIDDFNKFKFKIFDASPDEKNMAKKKLPLYFL